METGDVEDSGIGSVKGLYGNAKYWVGKDYTNFIVKDFNNLDRPYQGKIDQLLYNDTLMTLGLVVFGRFIVLKAIIKPILLSLNIFKKITKKLFNQLS